VLSHQAIANHTGATHHLLCHCYCAVVGVNLVLGVLFLPGSYVTGFGPACAPVTPSDFVHVCVSCVLTGTPPFAPPSHVHPTLASVEIADPALTASLLEGDQDAINKSIGIFLAPVDDHGREQDQGQGPEPGAGTWTPVWLFSTCFLSLPSLLLFHVVDSCS
jgi:hypothetical protein